MHKWNKCIAWPDNAGDVRMVWCGLFVMLLVLYGIFWHCKVWNGMPMQQGIEWVGLLQCNIGMVWFGLVWFVAM